MNVQRVNLKKKQSWAVQSKYYVRFTVTSLWLVSCKLETTYMYCTQSTKGGQTDLSFFFNNLFYLFITVIQLQCMSINITRTLAVC